MGVGLCDRGRVVLFEGLPDGFRAGFTTQAASTGAEDAALAQELGAPRSERVRARQVHGRTVLFVPGPAGDGRSVRLGEADGLVTGSAGRLLMVSTADCVPLLLFDEESGLIAAVHAGWRGTAARVVDAALDLLIAHGARPARLVALVGPSISRDRYEVGPEVVAALGDAPYEAVRPGRGDRSQVDVAAFGIARLLSRGLHEENVFIVPWCTYSDPRLPSYRRDGATAGRMLTGIVRT